MGRDFEELREWCKRLSTIRRNLETERDDLKRELAAARAEILKLYATDGKALMLVQGFRDDDYDMPEDLEDGLRAIDKERDRLRADKERLDFLESEMERDGMHSLFRQNMPITREAIDKAIEALAGGEVE